MEGLAAAGGVIAVGSFAVQLAETAQKIRNFVKKVAGALKEYERLISLLGVLERTLKAIGEDEKRRRGSDEFSKIIVSVLETCNDKLKDLEACTQSIEDVAKGKWKIARIFAAFRAAFKEKDIQDFERDLEHTLSLLNGVMLGGAKYVRATVFRIIVTFLGSIGNGIPI